jgi:hypothetical protein
MTEGEGMVRDVFGTTGPAMDWSRRCSSHHAGALLLK